ncbi:hypothetical protein EDB86DRAFT_2831291 [Lactarius hatsudake]|nr:hypothetical protein EDB86DRAFT_2831291 [Lactarius hatsudake]
MPLFQKGTSDKLTNGTPLPGLADDPYVHKHGVKSSRWGVRQELSEAHSTYGAARWQRENVTSTTGAISRLLRGKHGTLDVIADICRLRAGNLASTPAGRHNEKYFGKRHTNKRPGSNRSTHPNHKLIALLWALVLPVKMGSLVIAVIIRLITLDIMGRWQEKLHDSGKTTLRRVTEKRRYSVTRRRRVGRGEEVDDNGNAAPVRQEDTPARCDTISPRAVKRKVGSSQIGVSIAHMDVDESKWGHGAPVPPTSHTIDIQKEKQEGSPVTEVGCPVGGAKSNSHGVPICHYESVQGGQKIRENMKWNAERARWRHNVDSLKNKKGEGDDGSWTEARKYDMLEGPRLLELAIRTTSSS